VDFEVSPRVRQLQQQLEAFMDEHVYPNETVFREQVGRERWKSPPVVEEGIPGRHRRDHPPVAEKPSVVRGPARDEEPEQTPQDPGENREPEKPWDRESSHDSQSTPAPSTPYR